MYPLPAPAAATPHEPVIDDREPKTRRKLMFWDRAKLMAIIALVLAFSAAKRHADIPVLSWAEAFREEFQAKQWLLWLAAIEVLRQLHIFLSERLGGYHLFWRKQVWARRERWADKLNPWLRYRLDRAVKVVFWIVLGTFYLASQWDTTWIDALSQAPGRLWDIAFGPATAMPMIVTIAFSLLFAIGQFVAIFWFMSRGGTEVYMPEEVKTRFSDVWGQDRVLAQVKENIDFLEKPEEIEAKGGYVPAGILLWGPPGTGKTLMAEAVAGETGRPYVFVDPGAFQAMFFGVGIMKVKALFKKLRKLALRHGGVIVFFDEADSLGNRGAAVAGRERDTEVAFHTGHHCNGLHYAGHHTAHQLERAFLGLGEPLDASESRRSRIKQIIMTGGGGQGTLQSLLTELSGLKKPRGFVWRRIRKFLNMPPRAIPKYRLLIMMATNLPSALDEALLRPGRIDRIYKVDYPSLDGRVKTFDGYLNKVRHQITPDQVRKLSLMTPRGTGAVIKDIVNESLIVALRNGRDMVTWPDLLEAKQLKTYGMPDPVHTEALERHNVALHEASHAVAMKLLKRREAIDVATIEPRGPVGGFVAPVPLEEEGFPWRTTEEAEVMTFLASLAGERIFYEKDNSAGVGGDMRASTTMVYRMLGFAAMGERLSSQSVYMSGMGGMPGGEIAARVELKLKELYERVYELLMTNRRWVMAVAHALEEHKTITGEDIDAIFNGTRGPIVDGRWYHTDDFVDAYVRWHQAALDAHRNQTKLLAPFPQPNLASLPTASAPVDLPARPPTA